MRRNRPSSGSERRGLAGAILHQTQGRLQLACCLTTIVVAPEGTLRICKSGANADTHVFRDVGAAERHGQLDKALRELVGAHRAVAHGQRLRVS